MQATSSPVTLTTSIEVSPPTIMINTVEAELAGSVFITPRPVERPHLLVRRRQRANRLAGRC